MTTEPDTQPPPSTDTTDKVLIVLLVVCSAGSGGALLAHALGVISMPFAVSFFALPALLVTLVIGVWLGRVGRFLLLRRLVVGAVAGLLATIAYDVLRWIVAVSTPTDFDPFRAHRPFGALMLTVDPSTTAAFWAGWSYHVWNGVSFAVMYALIAGGARFQWAVAWALALETATILTYPDLFGLSLRDWGFVGISLFGHLCYGVTLGVLTRNWLGPGSPREVRRFPRPGLRRGLT